MAKIEAKVIGRPYRGLAVGDTLSLGRRDARLLARLGRVSLGGTYMTRDMVAQPPAAVSVTVPPTEPDRVDPLEGMDVEALRDLAKSRGVYVHHAAGAARIRQALRDAQPDESQ